MSRTRVKARRSRVFRTLRSTRCCGAFLISRTRAAGTIPFPRGPGGQAQRIALGSGFIVDPSGYVVTNNHVVGDAAKVQVILQDKTKYTAKIVGRDPKTDLAVLKIKADQPLPYVTFGDSSAAQVGDWVMAVGNPFGLGGTVTTGIISARGRDINEGPYDDFLQIDAPINRGNSGGPTFNLEGPGDRHQYRDLFAQWRQRRHRLCGPLERRQDHRRAARGARQDQPRLARRADPGGDPGDCGKPRSARRARRSRCRRHPQRPGAPRPASSRAM